MGGQPTYRIVLESSGEGQEEQIASALVGTFQLGQVMAGKIACAAPIALLCSLERDVALLLMQAMTRLRDQGAHLKVEAESARKLPKVAWPHPPRIEGKALSELVSPPPVRPGMAVISCPHCGEAISVELSAAASIAEVSPSPRLKVGGPVEKALTPESPTSTPSKKASETADDRERRDEDIPLYADLPPIPQQELHLDHMVGSLHEFETGLIDMYEVDPDEDTDGTTSEAKSDDT